MVNDDASPDDQLSILQERYKAPNMMFRRNTSNLLLWGNVTLGFVFARSDEFLWLLGDDDFVLPGALDHILEKISEDVDFLVFDPNASNIYECVQNYDAGWSGAVTLLGLTSNGIYNFNTISPFIKNAFTFQTCAWPHLAVAFSTIKHKFSVRIRAIPHNLILEDESMYGSNYPDASRERTGFLQLVSLLPPLAAKRLCCEWLDERGVGFFAHRRLNYQNYLHTMATVIYYGGVRAKLLLLKRYINYILWNYPAKFVTRNHDWIRDNLKPLLPGYVTSLLSNFRNKVYYELWIAE